MTSNSASLRTSSTGKNGADRPIPLFPPDAIEQSIPDCFEEQVRKDPDRLALVTDGRTLTYGQLNATANGLAARILDVTDTNEETVVLLMRQSALFVVAVLASLKAGKIYAPLDPDDREEANMAKLTDAGAGLIVTDRGNETAAARLAGHRTKVIIADDRVNPRAPNLRIEIQPHQPAYIYYTSGSTGRPKGVVDSHRNVLHNVMRYTNSLRISASDRLTLVQTPSFSGIVSSLFSALLNGATLYPYDLRTRGIAGLAGWIQENSLTMYHSVPSVFRVFLAGAGSIPSIRIIRLEGDEASSQDVDLFRRHFSRDCTLVNGLGTTETGLCRQFFVGQETQVPLGRLPVGYPVEDMEVVLVDERGTAVGPGETGQIEVRSRYLALGYWRQPQLTAERFIDGEMGQRRYRTGDLGRWMDGDCLLHLGRTDSSVKIRGLRVSLADVEDSLRCVPGVRQAAVTVHRDASSEGYLVGHVVRAPETDISAVEFREHLGKDLPSHMVPGNIRFLGELPVTQQGKIDRRALAATANGHRTGKVLFQPGTDTEAALAAIWSTLLPNAAFDADANFFDLGGHSLLAMQMLLEIERTLGHRLSPGVVVEAPTIRQLGKRIDGPSQNRSLVVLQQHDASPCFVWLPGADGDVYVFRQLAECLAPHLSSVAFEPPGLDGRSSPVDSVVSLANRYVDELLDRRIKGPFRLAGLCFGGFVAYEMAKQLEERGHDVALLVLLDCDGEWRTVSSWKESVLYHVRNLRRSSVTHWPRYLAERLSYRFEEMATTGRGVTKGMLASRNGGDVQRREVVQAARRASRRYAPAPQPRRLVYLRSRGQQYADPYRFWGRLVKDIQILNTEGTDAAIFRGYQVNRLADLLRTLGEDVTRAQVS